MLCLIGGLWGTLGTRWNHSTYLAVLISSLCWSMLLVIWKYLLTLWHLVRKACAEHWVGSLHGGMLLARWDCLTNLAALLGGLHEACSGQAGTAQLTLLCLVGGLCGGILLARWDCLTNLAVFGRQTAWWHVTGQVGLPD